MLGLYPWDESSPNTQKLLPGTIYQSEEQPLTVNNDESTVNNDEPSALDQCELQESMNSINNEEIPVATVDASPIVTTETFDPIEEIDLSVPSRRESDVNLLSFISEGHETEPGN